ncbi:DGQHR domain-containing protein [Mesorhizobium sp.]|uniref:DGQHR domain-containing protein n=1 Tax=Mesorhizobium sp. TaxID=1871066 RepID=UPI001209CB95|nr:DNA sulfur modification protein DndB [Mesorhizobium sp.]TIL65608.1 MAG: DGQHR domain-containing protein [Mesorhizobium sp.]
MTGTLFLPSLQGSFGSWLYYVALMRLSDLAERVTYARELQKNPQLSEVIQRRLDDSKRAQDIAEYLLQTPDRFFGSLVVGVMGGSPNWHPFGLSARRDEHKLGEVIERDQDLVGYLELSGKEKLFALDGQHRLAGIKQALATDAKLGREQVSVLFVGHKADQLGLRRTRGLFISLNKKAVPVQRRDIIILDEVDLPAIITRSLLDEHPWFSRGQVAADRFTTSIPAAAPEWTTIGNFYDTNANAIARVMALEHASELRTASRIRLEEDRIDYYRNLVVEYYGRLADLEPKLKDVFQEPAPGIVRAARKPPEPSLLFRPLGLKIVTRVLAALRRNHSLDESFAQLRRLPMSLSQPPYVGIIWDSAGDRMMMRGESLTTRLMLYMLGVAAGDDRLKRAYAEWFGKAVDEVQLPARLP